MRSKRIFQLLALITTVLGLLAIVWLLTQKSSPLYQPIKSYEMQTSLSQVSLVEIDEVVSPFFGLSFWEIPLNQIQANLTRLDWIKSAEVKRKWPNLLYISLVEQKPIARWNEDGLINEHGQVFFPNAFDDYHNLVTLQGELSDATTILQHLIDMQARFNEIGLVIAKLQLNEKVWRILVVDGTEIVVDSASYEKKIDRFVRAFPKLKEELRKSARIYDLRYSNGFIIANQ